MRKLLSTLRSYAPDGPPLPGVVCLWVFRGAADAQCAAVARVGGWPYALHQFFFYMALVCSRQNLSVSYGSAYRWVCRGAGDAHCAAVAVAGGGPSSARDCFL